MKCTRCGLLNPEGAQRCDCGYDFATHVVERPYFRQKLPTEVKGFFVFLIVWNALGILRVVDSASIYAVVAMVLWSAAIYPLYLQMVKKKPWARYVLMVLTFPFGTMILLMREVKLYMIQRD
jgi:sterol desaturase/sphingolipid hydroxylase (fatty acid hydroxylase superfamily)